MLFAPLQTIRKSFIVSLSSSPFTVITSVWELDPGFRKPHTVKRISKEESMLDAHPFKWLLPINITLCLQSVV
jgi:hypothetical protein